MSQDNVKKERTNETPRIERLKNVKKKRPAYGQLAIHIRIAVNNQPDRRFNASGSDMFAVKTVFRTFLKFKIGKSVATDDNRQIKIRKIVALRVFHPVTAGMRAKQHKLRNFAVAAEFLCFGGLRLLKFFKQDFGDKRQLAALAAAVDELNSLPAGQDVT